MEVLVFAALLGLIPAFIAQGKGRSFVLWWIYGALLFIVAIIHVLIIRPDQARIEDNQRVSGMKKCPNCAEMVKQEAKVCRFCQRDI